MNVIYFMDISPSLFTSTVVIVSKTINLMEKRNKYIY